MLILKLKQNATAFIDLLGNSYPEMVTGIDYKIDPIEKRMEVRLRYFKDTQSLLDRKYPVMVNEFFWNETGEPAIATNGSIIDWQVFMSEVPREEWKDNIQTIGRVPFDVLPVGIDATVSGFNFKENQVGQAWKDIMLFLPLNEVYANQISAKFLDEVFEYHNI